MASRVLAIGDVHGCLAPLDALLAHVAPTAGDHLIFLGDLIDRGPASMGVIDRVIGLTKTHRVSCIMGNHEEMMLDARSDPVTRHDWLRNGGDAALRSYGGARGSLRDVPAHHWAFLENTLVPHVETDTHLFVHASAYPDYPMEEQPGYMLRWERFDSVRRPHFSGKILVCGHTPQPDGRPHNKGFAVCIDTHAFRGGPLTCLDASSGKVHQAFPDGRVRVSHLVDFED
jgi:serine/threonine protein phosphatase 1